MNAEKSKSDGLMSALGPILLLAIGLATANMLSTYKGIHHEKQATLSDLIQQDREVGNAIFSAHQYMDNSQSDELLRQSYGELMKRFPATISSIENDNIFQQVSGLSDTIYPAFNHVKSAEQMILGADTIDKTQLDTWVNTLNDMNQQINKQVLDNVSSTSAEYSKKASGTIIKTAFILLVVIFTFILYLGYLLMALRKERKRNLHMLAHDPLTGLGSRAFVMMNLQSRCNSKTPFALMLFDLNKFKAVNDTFGHHVGDQLLIHLAGKFEQTLGKYGIVGRLGGDEFVWLAESDNPEVIEQQYALFLDDLKAPCMINGKRLHINLSAGGGIAADYDFHMTQLLERVDEAMYKAKSIQLKEILWESKAVYKALGKTNPYKLQRKTERRTKQGGSLEFSE